MFYICEFEFYDDGEGSVAALCLNGWGGATFGDNLEDAGESAADWLTCMVDDCLMNRRELPPVELGHEPQRGGMVVALAVSRELSNIPAMTAADAARELGVSTARITQLANARLLDSWKEGSRRMVSKASVEARLEDAQKQEDQNPQWNNQKADSRRRATSPATMRGFFFVAIPETCSIHEERLSQYNARAHAPRDAPQRVIANQMRRLPRRSVSACTWRTTRSGRASNSCRP